MMTMTLGDVVREAVEAQCDIENVTEGAYSVIGPLDFEELAAYLAAHIKRGQVVL